MRARKRKRAKAPIQRATLSSIYSGNCRIGDVAERAGRLRATGADGENRGTFRSIHDAMTALVSADRTRAAGGAP